MFSSSSPPPQTSHSSFPGSGGSYAMTSSSYMPAFEVSRPSISAIESFTRVAVPPRRERRPPPGPPSSAVCGAVLERMSTWSSAVAATAGSAAAEFMGASGGQDAGDGAAGSTGVMSGSGISP
eukprot:scaffold202145_cov29-Tisochrysis_lutea.AAC.5